ncbi:hypothetical protein [Micromonospora thermarum]|uniref:PknH-like extracellular domain-containing protein n=1 Tax=Micromonospora thermarum TaxID=2720024 RepID=A0ABX0ZAF2_9ACTN|nr:hypothetical protein [Micromonospora thermarum]NJP34887.1 hypothetical protein [Micromonospora thermarum]
MSDQLDTLFAGIRGARPPADFAAAEQVRRRGRQRTRRTALAAGAGVLAVTTAAAGLGAIVWPSRPDGVAPPADPTPTATAPSPTPPTPTPSPSRPGPTGNAAGGLLQPGDLGPGTWRPFEAEQIQNPDRWFWGFWDGVCAAYRSDLFPSLRHQDSVDTVAYRSGNGDAATSAFQIVERYETGWGDGNLDDVRAVVDRCGTAATDGPAIRVTVVDTGIAGDESVLLKQEQTPADSTEPQVDYIAVVRVGDLVTTVRAYPSDPDRVRDLAVRAAVRLG